MKIPFISLFRYFAISLFIFSSCTSDYTPKPRGYFRIDLPAHEYRLFDKNYPYTFEYPTYAVVVPDCTRLAEPYWINVVYPQIKAMLHISYKPVNNNLAAYLEDAHVLVNKHIQKANAITQQEYLDAPHRVFGLTYTIKGTDAASPFQFYLTDSASHFVRGALYFDVVPNNDSLAPVIDFLTQDVGRMIASFRWKN